MKSLSTPIVLALSGLILVNLAVCVTSSKILFLTPIATKSHKNVFDPLIDALALRGHELTVISPMKSSKVAGVKEIIPASLEDVMGTMKDAFQLRAEGTLSFLTSINLTSLEVTCNIMYEMEEVKRIMAHEKFDLILANGMISQCSYGLIHHFNVPHILITTMPASSTLARVTVGNNFPSSFVPEPFLPLSHKMTFKERMINLGVSFVLPALGHFLYNPKMESIYRKYIPDAPGVREIDGKTSMVFMNSHFSLTYPRPLLPSVIEVGGMHCRPGEPLPKDLDDFVSGAKDGFILFSLGSIVKGHNMPESTRKAFVNVFSKLKQRVVWKWDYDTMEDLPKNVKLVKWIPQQDLLAHPNIQLFITHGGLLSTQEAVYHGIPLIGIPFFADQDLNMGQAEKAGYCLTLEILNFSEEKLQAAVDKVLNKPEFKENVLALSKIYRDQPQTPLDRAIFYAEYVLRHKGAKHMESTAKDLNFLQYHSIDVIAFLSVILLTFLWLVKYILWNVLVCKCLCKLFGSKRKNKVDSSKKFK